MERDAIHDLTAAYALDALDPSDERAYEDHLARCARCREELAELRATAAVLAYVPEGPAPPVGLRERIIERAREERETVVPLRPRRLPVVLGGAAAAIAAVVAIAVGLWATTVAGDLDRERELVAILAHPDARSLELAGATGRVVVAPDGEAVLVVSGLDPAPDGRTYEAWVIAGGRAAPAGLFHGEDERDLLLLERRVPAVGQVAVTLERAGGVDQPTGEPLFATRS